MFHFPLEKKTDHSKKVDPVGTLTLKRESQSHKSREHIFGSCNIYIMNRKSHVSQTLIEPKSTQHEI